MPHSQDHELERRREAIRLGLGRANRAGLLILLLVVGLASWAVWKSFQATRTAHEAQGHAAEAESASARAESELWKALVAQSRASRLTTQAGRKANALEALSAAAHINPSPELRDEAIAALALTDLSEERSVPENPYVRLAPAFGNQFLRAAVLRDEQTLEVVNMESGKAELVMPMSRYYLMEMRMDPDEQWLALRYSDGTLELWNIPSRKIQWMKQVRPHWGSETMINFQEDKPRLWVYSSEQQIAVYGLDDGALLHDLVLPESSTAFFVNPAGTRLAMVKRDQCLILEADSGRVVQKKVFESNISKLDWHPDGLRIALGMADASIVIWDIQGNSVRVLEEHNGVVHHVRFSPDGDLLLSFSWDSTTRLWDVALGRSLLSTSSGFGMDFDESGSRVAWFRRARNFGVWRLQRSSVLEKMHSHFNVNLDGDGLNRNVDGVGFSRNGQWLGAVDKQHLRIWDADNLRLAASKPIPGVTSVLFHPSTNSLITSSQAGLFQIPWTTRGNNRFQLGEPTRLLVPRSSRFFERAAISSDLNYIAVVGGQDAGIVNLQQPASPLWLKDTPLGLVHVDVSRDGRYVAAGTWRGWGLGVWDGKSGQRLKQLSTKNSAAAFSPDGTLLAVTTSSGYTIYRTEDWSIQSQRRSFVAGGIPGAICFSRDGQYLAVSPGLPPVQLVDPVSGRILARLTAPHNRKVSCLTFSQDGSRLAAGTLNTHVDIWNLDELEQELGAINLSWKHDFQPVNTGSGQAVAPFQARMQETPDASMDLWSVWLPAMGVLMALVLGGVTVFYQRKWLGHYAAMERETVQRREELIRTQDELLQSQKMQALGTLAAGIAHDFNNLLSVIRLSNDFLSKGVGEDPDLKEETDSILRAVQQGKSVVNAMLGYTRTHEDDSGPVQVCEVVEDLVAMLRHQFLSGVDLTLDLDPRTPEIDTPRSAVQQVLLNLVVNACEAMNAKGKLAIRVGIEKEVHQGLIKSPGNAGRYLVLSVEDSGPGIPPESLTRIFEPFFTTKELGASPGRGLGLAMVYMIAKQRELGLAVTSTPEQGTAFRVMFPIGSSAPR